MGWKRGFDISWVTNKRLQKYLRVIPANVNAVVACSGK
jgi:hypothetical protein